MATDLDIFLNAPEDATPEQLAAYLDEACAGDPDLRVSVEALFAADRAPEAFADKAPRMPGEAHFATSLESEGSLIGPYKLLQKIGEGGFGDVYMAEQLRPVKRRVALKIIKLGMDTRQVVARFEAERQALAMMDHPNIAKVHDAGATDTGRPYFVMELVRGIPITKFCDEQNLDTAERLRLFVDVCHAVQHAHQKGVIHRDLKPNNVMVTIHDDRPVVKVIDFGVAKATQSDLTDKTLFTQFEQFIGTPAYMSPEQAQFSGLDIDTRSDIYTLGVLLYELLTGTTPFDARELQMAGQDEIRRIIKEDEPARPSLRLSTMGGAALTDLAKHRQTQPAKLPGLLRGDLDWIVMKALEKDRRRRYETANALATDVQRHLADEPVTAGAPGPAYLLSKYVRRHRALIGTAAAIATVLLVGTAVSTWQAIDANRARTIAETATRSEQQQREDAQEQERIARHNYVEELLSSGQSALGIAHLAKLIRDDPTNTIAAERLLSAIRHRELPETLATFGEGVYVFADLSDDGSMVVTADQEGNVQVWEVATGRPLGVPMLAPGEGGLLLGSVKFVPGDQRILVARAGWLNPTATAAVFDWKTGELIAKAFLDDVAQSYSVSPDGKLLLLGCPDQAIVWDVERDAPASEGRLTDLGYTADFSPDSTRVLSTSGRMFDARSGKLLRTFECPSDIYTLKFDSTGTRIVGGAWDRIVRVWDVESGAVIGQIPHPDSAFDATFDSEGRRLITACADGMARIWDSASFRLLKELPHGGVKIGWAAFVNDASRVVTTTTSGDFHLWDLGLENATSTRFAGDSFFQEHQLAPDGHTVLSHGGFNRTRLRALPRPHPKSQIVRHREYKDLDWMSEIVTAAAFHPSGDRFVTAAVDQELVVWDTASSLPESELLQPGELKWAAEFSSDGSLIYAVSQRGGIAVWDAADMSKIASLDFPARIRHARLSPARGPDGDYLMAALPERTGTGQLYRINVGASPDRQTVLLPVGLPLDGVELGSPGGEFLHSPNRIAFSPDGTRVAITATGGSARVWGIPGGELQLTLSGAHRQRTESIAFSPNGRMIATSSIDGSAALWDASRGRLIEVLPHGPQPVNHVEFSPDSATLVSAASDGTARLWDTSSGTARGLTLRHDRLIRSATFSPDSKRVLTASLDGSARIWDAATGLPLSDPLRHQGYLFSGSFSPDGDRVLTAGNDTTARLWDVPPAPSGPIPDWVPAWTEAVAGQKISADDTVTLLLPEEIRQTRELVLALPPNDLYVRTAHWFHADPETRPISPFSEVTTPAWIENRIAEDTLDSLEQALQVAPDHPGALAAMAGLKISDHDLRTAHQFATRLPEGRPRTRLLTEIDRLAANDALSTRVEELKREARSVATVDDLAAARNLARAAALGLTFVHLDDSLDRASAQVATLLDEIAGGEPLVPADATWRFLDDGRQPPSDWITADFDDSGWKPGVAPLGFGGFEHTTPVTGEDTAAVCYYFRHQFEVPDPAALAEDAMPIALTIRCDDGAAVYLNGSEIARLNLPEGELRHDSQAITVNGGRTATEVPINTGALLPGRNIIAVRVHQRHSENKVSSDLGLDLAIAPRLAPYDLLKISTEAELRSALLRLAPALPAGDLDRWRFALFGTGQPDTADWERRAKLQPHLAHWPATLEAADQALAVLAQSFEPAAVRRSRHLLRLKAEALHKLHGGGEQFWEQAKAIPPRDPSLSPGLIDFEPFYTESLHPRWHARLGGHVDGWARLAEAYDPGDGPPFDLRGRILLNSGVYPPGSGKMSGKDLNARFNSNHPLAVEGIPVGLQFETLHVLHAVRNTRADRGEVVARYVLHYEDGSAHEIPVIFGRDVFNDWQGWKTSLAPNRTPSNARLAWEHKFTTDEGDTRRLTLTRQKWKNPHPEKTVSHLDLVSTGERAGPVIYAITVD